jgi:hypothetical protein
MSRRQCRNHTPRFKAKVAPQGRSKAGSAGGAFRCSPRSVRRGSLWRFDMRTSHIGIHKRLTGCALLIGLVGLLLSSPAVADIYPIRGVWVAPNPDFPIRPDEACFTVRLSGIEAVTRKFISGLLIFNENKRYEVRQNTQAVSTLFSMKPAGDGYWVTELPDVRKRFWISQKITYLLTIIDPTTIEIRNNSHRTRFVKCGPRGKIPI